MQRHNLKERNMSKKARKIMSTIIILALVVVMVGSVIVAAIL